MSALTANGIDLDQVALRINAARTGTTGRGVTVALIDTGIAPNPMFADANVVLGPDFGGAAPTGLDTHGHGTHMAGIITTLAPDARLLSIRAGDATSEPHPATIAAAIDWLVDEAPQQGLAADVLVLAYGVDPKLAEARLVERAVSRAWRAGIAVVVAAGNGDGLLAPATVRRAIAVGGEGGVDGFALGDFSSRGTANRPLDILAPGRSVISARAVGAAADAENEAGRVGADQVRSTGTSQSAAVVGAALALVLGEYRVDNDTLKAALMMSAAPVAGAEAGALDVEALLSAASAVTVPQSAAVRALTTEAAATLDSVWQGSSWLGSSWLGTRWQGSSWLGSSWLGSSWLGTRWQGSSWLGSSWLGTRWQGSSWLGSSWLGSSWLGSSWLGSSWLGTRWQGSSWLGSSWLGSSWLGSSWLGSSWLGTRWQGSSWLGTRWQGSSWLGSSWLGSSWLGSSWLGTRWT